MLASQRRIEVLVKEVEWALISPLEDDLDGVLEVNAHLVGLQILLRLLPESILGSLLLALDAEDATLRWFSWYLRLLSCL